jgi:hypothetical protein
MPIPVNCPSCERSLQIPDKFSGKRVRCPQCDTRIQVPLLVQPPAPSLEIDLSEDPPPANVSPPARKKTYGIEHSRFGLTEGVAQLFAAAWLFIVIGTIAGACLAENGWLFFAAVGAGASVFFGVFGYLALIAILRNLQAIRQAVEEVAENRTS